MLSALSFPFQLCICIDIFTELVLFWWTNKLMMMMIFIESEESARRFGLRSYSYSMSA